MVKSELSLASFQAFSDFETKILYSVNLSSGIFFVFSYSNLTLSTIALVTTSKSFIGSKYSINSCILGDVCNLYNSPDKYPKTLLLKSDPFLGMYTLASQYKTLVAHER